MADYSMVGRGTFGGHNNFLGLLGGIGEDWAYGMGQGMKFNSALMDYQNKVYTNPSHVEAQIASNIAKKGEAEGNHYVNYLDNQVLSYLAGGGNPADPRSPFNGAWARWQWGQFANNAQTPANTAANTAAKPVQMNASGMPTGTSSNNGVTINVPDTGGQSVIWNDEKQGF